MGQAVVGLWKGKVDTLLNYHKQKLPPILMTGVPRSVHLLLIDKQVPLQLSMHSVSQ
jgi:hypothetical protein